jgi:hypothetical protein
LKATIEQDKYQRTLLVKLVQRCTTKSTGDIVTTNTCMISSKKPSDLLVYNPNFVEARKEHNLEFKSKVLKSEQLLLLRLLI